MKRRDFLRAGMCGGAAASAAGVFGGTAFAAEGELPAVDVHPESLAEATVKHFLPGKKTCSESILMAGCQALGIQSDLVPDIALGLAGGIGLQGKTCGVVPGAAMVLSLAVASKEPDYQKRKPRVFKAVGDLCKRFEAEFGTTECSKLCGLDLTTPEGRKILQERVKAEKCQIYVRACARMLAEALPNA